MFTISVRPMSDTEIIAMRTMQKKYGPTWKRALIHKWKYNRCYLEMYGDVLMSLYRELGQDWLRYYQLPEPRSLDHDAVS